MYYAGAGHRQLGRPRGSFLVEGRHCGSQLLLECQEYITFCTALIFNGLEGLLDGRKMGISLMAVFCVLFLFDIVFQVGEVIGIVDSFQPVLHEGLRARLNEFFGSPRRHFCLIERLCSSDLSDKC